MMTREVFEHCSALFYRSFKTLTKKQSGIQQLSLEFFRVWLEFLWDTTHQLTGAKRREFEGMIHNHYNVRPPSYVCWIISPSNYSYKYHKP